MHAKTKLQIASDLGIQDGKDAAVRWFNSPDRKHYPYDLYAHMEKYGFRQKYSAPGHLYTNRWMREYRSKWYESFETQIRQMYRQLYANRIHHDDIIHERDLVEVTGEQANKILDAVSDDFVLFIECSLCGNISVYAGYPRVPETSTVMCLTCGYLQVGGTKYMPRQLIPQNLVPPT